MSVFRFVYCWTVGVCMCVQQCEQDRLNREGIPGDATTDSFGEKKKLFNTFYVFERSEADGEKMGK